MYMERTLKEGSLTIMTVKQDGPSLVRQSVVRVLRRTLRKCWETFIRGVSDHHDDHAGWTVVGTTVRRRTLRKCWETLIRGVSDHHDGRAGWTVVGMTVHHMCPLKDT